MGRIQSLYMTTSTFLKNNIHISIFKMQLKSRNYESVFDKNNMFSITRPRGRVTSRSLGTGNPEDV